MRDLHRAFPGMRASGVVRRAQAGAEYVESHFKADHASAVSSVEAETS